jgi:Tfp pilus assembly pilus retraction ATPase PilT
LKRADGQGRVVAVEILLGSNAVSALIREKKVHQIPSVIQTSRREGMLLLEDSLAGLVKSGLVTAEEARRFSMARAGPTADGAEASAAPSPAAPAGAAAPPRASGAPASPGR